MKGVDDNKLEPSDEYKFKCSICHNAKSPRCQICKNQDQFQNAFGRHREGGETSAPPSTIRDYFDYNYVVVEGNKKILEFFGNNAQHMKTFEEIGEFQQELSRANREGIKNEMADLMVMLNQMQIVYQIDTSDIMEIMMAKVKRTLAKIDSLKAEVSHEC